jgi:ubiquinone/menaquinone biosynthesis C-methylase UbiE
MELHTAIKLIRKGVRPDGTQTWADLGAGSGLFTQALAALLQEPSTIFAIDKTPSIDERIVSSSTHIIKAIGTDFTNTNTLPPKLNGIILANSLHYVSDKRKFLNAIKKKLLPDGSLIIVEYEMTKANPWVPYPVTTESLGLLLAETGYKSFAIMEQHPSMINGMMMYSSVCRA